MRRLMVLLVTGLLAVVVPATAAFAAARRIVLVRHGHYVEDPAVDEKIGPPLSALGMAQAHVAGARLAGLGLHFDAFHVSPMQRARDTAAAIHASLPDSHFKVDADLAECLPPTRRKEVSADTPVAEQAACKAQLDRLFDRYFHPASGDAEQAELFVCHGDVIRYLVTRALGVDTEAWLEMSVRHASLTEILVEADGRFKVISVGDDGFLPASLLSGATGDVERGVSGEGEE